jgi:hypothetical protein
MVGTEADVAPVISSEKAVFGLKRLFATATGGVRTCAGVPFVLYMAEVFMFLAPVGAGVGLTVAYDRNEFMGLPLWVAAVILGGMRIAGNSRLLTRRVGVCVLVMFGARTWAGVTRMRASRVVHPAGAIADDSDDEDERTCCSVPTADALSPSQSSWIGTILHMLFVFAAGAGAVFMLLPSRVVSLYVTNLFSLFFLIACLCLFRMYADWVRLCCAIP